MINKRHLHYVHRRLEPVSPWFFLALALVFAVISVGALRQNNIRMLELREAVYAADKDNGDVETALRELREHVYAHMNTDLTASSNGIYPPIQLKYRYERLVEAETKKAANADEDVYAAAQKYCEKKYPAGFFGSGRIPCIQEYVSDRGAKTTEVVTIPDALYKFDFESPRWSPDLAGWSLVLTGVFLMLFIVRWGSEWWMRSQL